MKLHRKAKTTPASRATLVQRATAGATKRLPATWRFRYGGAAALEDGSSRPRRTPHHAP